MDSRARHEQAMAALRQRIAGRQTLLEAVDAANAAETPEQYKRALTRIVAVIAANDRDRAVWRRRRELTGK